MYEITRTIREYVRVDQIMHPFKLLKKKYKHSS